MKWHRAAKKTITPIFWHIAQTGLIERWDTSQTLVLEPDLSTHFRRGLTYGLIPNAVESQVIKTRPGAPTPDDLDELITKVWKEPAFFLAHPRAIAAFGREATRRGVPPPTVTLFGSPFITWRGIPLVPSDKLAIDENNKTKILLLRTGEKKQGVVGLFQPGLPGEVSPSLSVRFMGINHKAVASYLVSLYCSLAVLTEDALGVLEDVDVGQYHEYK